MAKTIADEIQELLPIAAGKITVGVCDGKVVCNIRDRADVRTPVVTALVQLLNTMIRDKDLMGNKMGSVTTNDSIENTTCSVNIADLHKSYQEKCGVSVNGRPPS